MWSITGSPSPRINYPATARHPIDCFSSRCIKKKSVGLPSITRQSRQFSSHVSPRVKAYLSRSMLSYLGVLSVGLVTGGGLAIYLETRKQRGSAEQEKSGVDVGVLFQESLGTASCHHVNARDELAVKDNQYDSPGRFEPAIKKARDLLRRAKDEVGSPGIVAAVSVDGRLVWSEGLGYADMENRTPCTPSSVMRIASISKPLAMTAVARLWEEGKLDLDKPVQEYIPDFPEKEWEGEKVSITTRLLASHLSGIRHYQTAYMNKKKDSKEHVTDSKKIDNGTVQNMSKSGKEADTTKRGAIAFKDECELREMQSKKEFKSVDESLAMFEDDPLVHKPGKYLYSTHGWTVVSAVVEGASGKEFLAYMSPMLRDLGLKDTIPDKHIPIIYNRARGYQYNKRGKLENCPYVDLSYKWAGGGYLSTVTDLVKFGNAMLYSYQYLPVHKEQNFLPGFLKPETMRAIWTPNPAARSKPTSDYCFGLGWMVSEKEQQYGQCRPQRHFVMHSGGAMGFSSFLTVVPTSKLAIKPNTELPESGDSTIAKDLEQKHAPSNSHEDSTTVSKERVEPPPKGIVVALIANLLDAGLSKTAEEIVEVFQECQDSEI